MARKNVSIDFMKIAKTVGGGMAASLAEDFISKSLPMVNNNPMVQKLMPAGIGLVVDMVLPNQPEIAAGCYGAAGYKLGKHFAPTMNGLPGAINGTPGAINGEEEQANENFKRLQSLKEKAQRSLEINGESQNFAQKALEKKYGFR